MSKTRYQLQESYESVIRKFDEIDNSMKRTEGLIKGLYFLLGIIFVVTIMSGCSMNGGVAENVINRQLELKISEIAEKDVDAARLLREVVDSVAPNRAFPADPANELNCETYYFDTPGIEPHSVCKEKSKSTDLESVYDWDIIMESILCYMVIIWYACNQRIYTSTC